MKQFVASNRTFTGDTVLSDVYLMAYRGLPIVVL